MNSLKEGLEDYFDVETGKLCITFGSKRNKETKDFRFGIRVQSINKFLSNIEWIK